MLKTWNLTLMVSTFLLVLFGTFLYKPHEDIGVIGIRENMPARFLQQLAAPFVWTRIQRPGSDIDTL